MVTQKYIFIRHGETDDNVIRKYSGQTETPLNEKGFTQADQLKEIVKEYEPYIIFSSPQQRCKDTAKTIFGLHDTITFADELTEFNFGIFEGYTHSELQKKFPEDIKNWFENWETYSIPEGEGVPDIYKRATDFFKSLENEYPGCNILFVTHYGIIASALTYFLHGSIDGFWKYELDNASITVLEKEKFFRLKAFNKTK